MDIRAAYVAVIGEADVEKIEAAGLLPTIEEFQWRVDAASRVITDTRDTVPYIKQHRLATGWADLD